MKGAARMCVCVCSGRFSFFFFFSFSFFSPSGFAGLLPNLSFWLYFFLRCIFFHEWLRVVTYPG